MPELEALQQQLTDIEKELSGKLGDEAAYPEAIRALEELEKQGLTTAGLYFNRGHHHLTISEYDEADADMSKALELDGTFWKQWHYKAIIEYARGNFAAAADCYDGARRVLAEGASQWACITFWQYVMLLRAGQKDTERAANLLETIGPETEGQNQGYKDMLMLLRGFMTEEEYLAALEGKDAKYVSAYNFALSVYCLQQGRREEARKALETVLANTEGWYAISYIVSRIDISRT